MRFRPFRVTSVWAKVLYVGIYSIAVTVVGFQSVLNGADLLAYFIFRAVADTAAILLGVRSFRSRGEAIVPERPWWKGTGRPLAGFVIAGLFGLSLLIGLASVLSDLSPRGILISAISLMTTAAYGVFYLNSSLRLRREPAGRAWVSRTRNPNF